ncbi:MAG: hypothetical protein IKT07_10670 [Oscillospiraceae bacterium]|nr:hypothetical protein [Oscillospiraceae bacterium]
MMMREERAKQFQPFDSMKGLQEALRDREERHSRVERHEISEEKQEKNSEVFARLEKGMRIRLEYYSRFHDIIGQGMVTEVSTAFRYLKLDKEKIFFSDIYDITVLEWSEDN